MKIKLNHITGIADSMIAMHMSRRQWNEDLEALIEHICERSNDEKGFYKGENNVDTETYNSYLDKVLKWGRKHITLLKFIDISVTVQGLHRAGQDDWDSHAYRFHNRIVRMSTRDQDLRENGTIPVSEWYEGKIVPLDDALRKLNIDIPDSYVDENGIKYVRNTNGFVREDLKDNGDVRRGLYMLSIPSNFIFRCNLADWAHVYQQRGQHGRANPEVKKCCETIATQLNEAQPKFTRELFMEIDN